MRVPGSMLLLAVALLPGMAYAQQHQHAQQSAQPEGMMQMHAMMHMQAMTPGPMTILQLREQLGLTDAQVQRIEAIRDRFERTNEPHMRMAMQAMHEAAGTLGESAPNLSRYEEKLREAANHHVLAQVTMMRGWLESREVLTPEQRTKLQVGLTITR